MRESLEIEIPIFTLRALQIYFNNKTNSDQFQLIIDFNQEHTQKLFNLIK